MTHASLNHPQPSLSRRSLLLAGGALGVSTLIPSVAAQASPKPKAPTPLRAATDFLDVMQHRYVEAGKPNLPQSYADEIGLKATSFVYDASLAVCAAIAAGRLQLAREIGDGLLYAQAHDPVYSDGRLRQGYNVGDYVFYDGVRSPYGLVLPDGHANMCWQFGFLGTAVGDMAWPGIALVQLFRATRDRRYLAGARRIAEWIPAKATNPGPLGGFSQGRDAGDTRWPWGSTEHNIDCVAFYSMLNSVDRSTSWRTARDRARGFVDAMWEPSAGFFFTGTPDGTAIDSRVKPLDTQTWSWLALREHRYARSLDWARQHLAATDVAGAPNSQLPAGVTISGVTYGSESLTSTGSYNGITVDKQGVWLEGTGQLACALADRGQRGDKSAASGYLRQVTLAQARVGQGQHVGGQALAMGGVVAASSLIDTGFGFGYFQAAHVGATSWYVMASLGVNPLRLY